MQIAYESESHDAHGFDSVSIEFAGQIATAVWLGKLSDEGAREALWSYAMACHAGARLDAARMLEGLITEYQRRRAGQELCW